MPRHRQGTPPAYRLHKARNLAVVTINGQDHYLGPYGSPESHQRYGELIYGDGPPSVAGAKSDVDDGASKPPLPKHSDVRVGKLTLAYFDQHAVHYYRGNDESPGRLPVVQAALRAVNEPFARAEARKFGPLRLAKVRDRLIQSGRSRVYINDLISIIIAAFKWAASKEMIPFRTYQRLTTLEPLKKNRSAAKESRRVLPVETTSLEKTLACLSPTLAALVQLQLLTGARPGELRRLRPMDVERSTEGPWCYSPLQHKNLHRDIERRIYFGPRARQLLAPFLERRADEFCFSPRDAELWNRTQRAGQSKAGLEGRVFKIRANIKAFYTKDAYRKAVVRACKKAGVPAWNPHRLRHNAATDLRRRCGIEASKVALGLADIETAAIYAERDFSIAAQVIEQHG